MKAEGIVPDPLNVLLRIQHTFHSHGSGYASGVDVSFHHTVVNAALGLSDGGLIDLFLGYVAPEIVLIGLPGIVRRVVQHIADDLELVL